MINKGYDKLKQGHFDTVLVLISITYVLLMGMIFNVKWADEAWSISLVDFVGNVIPTIKNLKGMPDYSNYIGLFYAVIWLFSPIMFILGWMSIVFASFEFMEKWKEMSSFSFWARIVFIFIILFYMMDMSVYPDKSDWRQNQMTSGFIGKCFSAFIYFGIPYCFGAIFRILFNRKFKQSK